MLVDLMMLLSSSILLLADPGDSQFDELDTIFKHFRKSRKKFRDEGKDSTYWPHYLYCLFR
jgi:hypothetical protein